MSACTWGRVHAWAPRRSSRAAAAAAGCPLLPACLPACLPTPSRPLPPSLSPPAHHHLYAGSSTAWGRDQDVALDFPTLAKVLTKVARGETESIPYNQAERFFYMTAEDM